MFSFFRVLIFFKDLFASSNPVGVRIVLKSFLKILIIQSKILIPAMAQFSNETT